MNRRLATVLTAAAIAFAVAPTIDAAASTYVVGTYGAANYGEAMVSFTIPSDCRTDRTPYRWTMPTTPVNVRDRLSSLAMFVTLPSQVKHCNYLGVVSKTTGTTQWKCVASNNRGMPTLDANHNDKAAAVVLRYGSGCPLYNLAA